MEENEVVAMICAAGDSKAYVITLEQGRQINQIFAENTKLRELVEYAFRGGFEAGTEFTAASYNDFVDGIRPNLNQAWSESVAKTLLESKPNG